MTGDFEGIAIGLSVLMHATWNPIARLQRRDSEPLSWVLLGHRVLMAPGGLVAMARTVRGNDDGKTLPWTLPAMLAKSACSQSDRAATAQIACVGGIVGYRGVGYLAVRLTMSRRLR